MHDDGVAQHGGHTPNNRFTDTSSLGLQCNSLTLDIHVMINWKQCIRWSISRDHIAGSIDSLPRSCVFWSWPLAKCWFSFGSGAHVSITCWKQGRIVWKPSPGLKFIRIITLSSIQMFFAALFWVYGDYKTQNRNSNSKQKTSPRSYKTQINILPFPGLTQSSTEQPAQGATLLRPNYIENFSPGWNCNKSS